MNRVPSEAWSDWLRGRMFDFRVVSLTGTLDETLATQIAAELMTLDATGDDAIRLLVDSGDGALDAALTLVDVIDLLGVPVHATCVGRADGPAAGVVAVATKRTAAPHARFRLRMPDATFSGRSEDFVTWAAHRDAQLQRYCERLALATRREAGEIAAAVEDGRYFDAEAARRFGLVDEIARPTVASVHRFEGRELGFALRPRRR